MAAILRQEEEPIDEADAVQVLQREDYATPEWTRFREANFRPPPPADREAGEWEHGWQFHACAARDNHFAAHVRLPSLTPDLRFCFFRAEVKPSPIHLMDAQLYDLGPEL